MRDDLLRRVAQNFYDSNSAFGWDNLPEEGHAYWMNRLAPVVDATIESERKSLVEFFKSDAGWDALCDAVMDGGSGLMEPEDYYEGVTDAVLGVILDALGEA